MIPDGVSRSPVDRDLLILARIGEWAQHRSNIRGIAPGLESGKYDDEDPPIYSKESLAKELAAVQKREKETPTPDREVGKGGHRIGWGEPLMLPDKPWGSKKPKPRPQKPPKVLSRNPRGKLPPKKPSRRLSRKHRFTSMIRSVPGIPRLPRRST